MAVSAVKLAEESARLKAYPMQSQLVDQLEAGSEEELAEEWAAT